MFSTSTQLLHNNGTISSCLLHDSIMTGSFEQDFFLTCSQLLHNLVTTYSKLIHDLFTPCSQPNIYLLLVHILFNTFHDFSQVIYDLFWTCLRLIRKSFINFSQLVQDFCQAQPEPQLQLSWAEIALFSNKRTTHPPGHPPTHPPTRKVRNLI